MKKYEFTDEVIRFYDATLHRIRALVDIPSIGVKAGDLGGFLQFKKNLSVSGDAWVSGDARVSGDAWDVSPLYIQGSKWSVCVPKKGFLKVGCQCWSMEEWRTVWKDVAREHDAQDLVHEYVLYYNLAAQRYGYPLLDIPENQQQNKTEGENDE